MGLMDKLRKMTGSNTEYEDLYEDDYYNEFDDGYASDQQGEQPEAPHAAPAAQPMTAGPANIGSPMTSGMSLNGSAIELKVVKPEKFENVSQIADHLLNRRTVVLNLEATNKETARRLIDFLSGVAYSIDGQLKRVANNAYVITPSNVDVSGDQLRDKKQANPPQQENNAGDFYNDLV